MRAGERTEVRGSLDTPQWDNSLPAFVFSASNPQSEIYNPQLLVAQATGDLPTAADLAETPEVQFTPEIRDLANQLGNNSLGIYEAIRNNFKYEPYYGSLKGAQQTLREKAGNDFDLASLLISCYRAAGIPARYTIATISMPLSQAQNWLGLDDPRMVGRLFASAGVPVAVDYAAGIIRLEHVFVQAWVPYRNGRGALNGPGDTWVYMDPSYKETKITQILDQAIPAFDQTQYLSQLHAEDPSEYYSGLVLENLNTTAPGRTIYAVARHSNLVPLYLGLLVGMPQYDIITAGGHFQEIPDQYRHRIAFEITETELHGISLAYQKSTAELAGKRITLSYSPATSRDQSIINSYGDIYSTPAYLIKLKPELRIEGVSAAQGLSIGFGSTQTFTLKINSPGGDTEQIENNVVSGAYYAVALDLQTVTQGMVFERTQKLKSTSDIISAGGIVSMDDHAGELLYVTALAYFQKLDAANRKAQELLKITDLRGVSEAIFSIDVQTAYVFGVPKSVDVSGVHIDVDRDMHLPIPVDGNTVKIKEYNLLIGSNSSYFEHKIIEDIYPTEAISAVKGLQLANAQGIQIHAISRDNINAILPTLQVRAEIQTDIANAVNAGKEVIVPQQEISLNDWRGVGYIAMTPVTGEAAYLISGGLAGGDATTLSFADYIKAKAMSGNVAAYKEIAYIENCLDRDAIIFPGSDNMLGTLDDVLLVIAKPSFQQFVEGPAGTTCANQTQNNFAAPHPAIAAPLLELYSGVQNKQLSKHLKAGEMSGGENWHARITSGFVLALDAYIQALLDANIKLGSQKIAVAYRSWYHNCDLQNQGYDPAPNSYHMDGLAADVTLLTSGDKSGAQSIALSMMGPQGGVGYMTYSTMVHIDFGPGGRTW